MYERFRLILTVVAAVGAAACGSPKPIKYYSIQIPAAPSPSTHTYAVDLTVARVSGPDLLASEPIIYKTSANEMGTYAYHRWTAAPVEMVQEKLVRLLRTSGEYESVTPAIGSGGPLSVRGRLYDFAEVDGDGIAGLVTMEFELYDRKAAKVLWRHFYSQTEPAQAKNVPAVVQALDRNLDRGLNEVVANLSKYFAAHPPAAN